MRVAYRFEQVRFGVGGISRGPGPAPPLELTDRIAERFGGAPHHAVVSAALRELEREGDVESWIDTGPLPPARLGYPRRIYRLGKAA